jgi:hypothetical protein
MKAFSQKITLKQAARSPRFQQMIPPVNTPGGHAARSFRATAFSPPIGCFSNLPPKSKFLAVMKKFPVITGVAVATSLADDSTEQ